MARKFGYLIGAALLLCGGTAFAEDKALNVYNWTDLVGESTIAGFTKKTGIKVNYDTYDSDEILEAKLMAGSTGYDIVVPTGTFVGNQIKAGVLKELDKSKIPNWKNLDTGLLKLIAPADPGNKHAVVYDWGTTGLSINVKEVEKRLPGVKLDSYDLLFKPEYVSKLKDCGVTVVDSPADVVPIILHYLGLNPASENPDDLNKAKAVLMGLRPYIKYINSSTYLNDMADGEVCLALAWSGDVSIANKRAAEAKNGVQLQYVVPKEGTITWFGVMAIPADAPHPEAAYAFINYILDPKVAADFTNTVGYGSGVPDSVKYLNPSYANDHSIFPTAEDRAKLFASPTVSQKFARERTRVWTSFKSGM
ncbi:MAG: polyamine ABC transporter substrate-binding protein [Rhodospirillaceae bacterium]|nr:MAG: polyamine ABC transporter substrate-binding protein [Rhodospirillaceae bacterium]